MLEMIACLSLLCAGALLFALCVIDLKIRLLPDELVLGFLCCAMVFHLCTMFSFVDKLGMIEGAFYGGGTLYIIRAIANRFYGRDTLGLGDVKLMFVGGVWLGGQYIMLALTLGALAGIIHGVGYALYERKKYGVMPSLNTLAIPAGPGFAVGLVVTAFIVFYGFPLMVLEAF